MQSLSIDAAEQVFQDWRTNRVKGKDVIPPSLWEMALSLYPDHKSSEICKRLHLSGGQFKAQLNRKKAVALKPGKDGFVMATTEVPSAGIHGSTPLEEATIKVEGVNRSLSLKLAIKDIPQMLPALAVLL
jgi:hypothetical protein